MVGNVVDGHFPSLQLVSAWQERSCNDSLICFISIWKLLSFFFFFCCLVFAKELTVITEMSINQDQGVPVLAPKLSNCQITNICGNACQIFCGSSDSMCH